MANTEGLSDEAVSSLLALPSAEEEQEQRNAAAEHTKLKAPGFPQRSLARREQMMELAEGEAPAATVVRSSKPPKIHASASVKKRDGMASVADNNNIAPASLETAEKAKITDINEGGPDDHKTNPKPVILSECIRERPVGQHKDNAPTAPVAAKRVSRFKQRNRSKNDLGAPTAGGFPSLDIAPVGAFTRNGRTAARGQNPTIIERAEAVPRSMPTATASTTKLNAGKDIDLAADSMLANMSLEEIRDGVEEVKSLLSAKSIEFLRRRGRQKQAEGKGSGMKGVSSPEMQPSPSSEPTLTKQEEIQNEEKKEQEGKEKMAELLSSVRTPDDMDRVYKEALQLGLAPELPSSSLNTAVEGKSCGEGDERMKNLHTATSLLRSTAPRQRLLGARTLCHILEEDANDFDDREALQKTYPTLLPVAIRCLLDDSIAAYQTAEGRLLLSLVLRCIRALMTLFVHPYHVVDVSPASDGCSDPFVLYQTHFMQDISHVPPGTELYAPTQITPIAGGEANNASCYRADSSVATAESDSKAFYNDPAWTLLSRMRILPCLSDVLRCLSADYATGTAIAGETIQSICGILAMLAVRSPGAAGAIARHKGILPFLVSYCLSPPDGIRSQEKGQSESKHGSGDTDLGLFDAEVAIPALILLCHLARQSRDIAELEMPFRAAIPGLQAMLLVDTRSNQGPQLKVWSIALLRILIRYGLATEHIQTLIGIVAPRVELMKPKDRLSAHYLTLFANVCDASRIAQQSANGDGMTVIPEEDGNLAMSGVWLTPSVRACSTSFPSVVSGGGVNHTKLASAQLRLLAAFIDTASPTKAEASIPILSNEACIQVTKAALESEILDNTLNVALESSFGANCCIPDHSDSHSFEEEATACSFVSSFMSFVNAVGHGAFDAELRTRLRNKIVAHLKQFNRRSRQGPSTPARHNVHPARQSWFAESEFAVLRALCADPSGQESNAHLLSAFAFSLIGRLSIGHEGMAAYIFRLDKLFQVTNGADQADFGQSLQALFLRELSLDDRKLQLNHSSGLYFLRGQLSSLRCTADYVGSSTSDRVERFVLPLGGTWMWNVLSSTTSQPGREPLSEDEHVYELVGIVSQTLSILLHLEMATERSYYAASINNGTKLYQLANVCLLPEEVLSNEFVESAVEVLFKQFSGYSQRSGEGSSLVRDFIMACFEHSRLSRGTKKRAEEGEEDSSERQLEMLLNPDQPSKDFSNDELKALSDFVDDLCESFTEYGGQYSSCTHFIRFFLRHDFPAKVTSTVLSKLHPILHLLTIEGEQREGLQLSLSQTISGGLPSLDSSRRDPSSVLDSFASSVKQRNKELARGDYAYLLAVAVLSRNLASSSQRCECGLQAMKNRLSGVSDPLFYDVVQVADKFLRSGEGTQDCLVDSVLEICLNEQKGLLAQESSTQNGWHWTTDASAVWERTVDSLRAK